MDSLIFLLIRVFYRTIRAQKFSDHLLRSRSGPNYSVVIIEFYDWFE